MKRFKVKMYASESLYAEITIKAESEEDAYDKAHDLSYDGKVKWKSQGIDGESVGVEDIEEES